MVTTAAVLSTVARRELVGTLGVFAGFLTVSAPTVIPTVPSPEQFVISTEAEAVFPELITGTSQVTQPVVSTVISES